MHYELEINDKVVITTQEGDIYNAIVLDITTNDLFLKIAGFGKLNIKWNDIWLVQKIISPICRGMSYSPSYKVRVWQNDNPTAAAS